MISTLARTGVKTFQSKSNKTALQKIQISKKVAAYRIVKVLMTKLDNLKLNMKVVKEKVRQVKIKIQALKLTSKLIRTVKLRKF